MLNSVSILIQVCERASRVSQLPISTVILLIRYRLTPLIAAVFSRTFHRNMTEPGICCRSVTLDGAVCLSAREDGEFIRFLFTDMRREKTREELNQLFYPDLSRMTAGEKGELYGTEYLVCKQIIRDHDEFAGRRGCRINAEPGKEGGFTIYFTLPKK